MKLRPALAADAPALAGLWRQVDELHARLLPTYFRVASDGPTRPLSDLGRILASGTEALFVAEESGVLLGFVHAQIYDTPAAPTMTPRRRAHVDDLIVDKSHRRRGVGRALMQAAEIWARDRGAAEVVLTLWRGNKSAEAFYAGVGYQPLSTVLHREI